MLSDLLVLAAVITAGVINRARVLATVERAYAAKFPRNADGIVTGAASFTLQGHNNRGLLLLHGSGDSPQSLRYLADCLHAEGYSVHAPLLPGHGRSPHAFARASAEEYFNTARDALADVRSRTPWFGVVGLSMGGALAARLASEAPDVRVLVLLAPYIIPPGSVRRTLRLSWIWSPFAPYLRGRGESSVHDTSARAQSRAYGSFSAGALRALCQTADAGRQVLRRLVLPTLVINSKQDNRIPRALALVVLSELPAATERHWVTGCGHVITVDACKSTVADLVVAFLARHAD